jgi:hypothetical protein
MGRGKGESGREAPDRRERWGRSKKVQKGQQLTNIDCVEKVKNRTKTGRLLPALTAGKIPN